MRKIALICKAENQHVIVDGRIDPSKTKDGSYYPPSAGHTLHLMNMTYRRRFRDSHDAMERDVTCPIALRVKFGFYDDIPLWPTVSRPSTQAGAGGGRALAGR